MAVPTATLSFPGSFTILPSIDRLYQSAGRRAEAHAPLAPVLEGFTPTPEFLEIEQAQSLRDALRRRRGAQGEGR